MRNEIVAAVAVLLLVTAEDSNAQSRKFLHQWEGLDASGNGFITLDLATVANPGGSSTESVIDFDLVVTGAFSGNGTFLLADYDGLDTASPGGIHFDTGDTALDLTRELVGQPTGESTWGDPNIGNGEFSFSRDFGTLAPSKNGDFEFITGTGSDQLALTSFRPALCGDAPLSTASCHAASDTLLSIKDNEDNEDDSLKWLWKGAGFEEADFGDPAAGDTYYSLCIYDETATIPALSRELGVNRGEGWTDRGPRGLQYRGSGRSFGVKGIRIKPSGQGTAMKVEAGAEALNLPAPLGTEFFDQDGAVTVQLVTSEGECWTSSFAASDTSRNDEVGFRARASD